MQAYDIEVLKHLLKVVPDRKVWENFSFLDETIRRVEGAYLQDLDVLISDCVYLFEKKIGSAEELSATEKLINKWIETKRPAIPSFMSFLLTNFGFDSVEDKKFFDICMIAAVLAEVINHQAYHSNLHFLKVLLHAARLIIAHNAIYDDTMNTMDKTEIAMLLSAAAVHDLGHPGAVNAYNHAPFELELKSFEYALPFLKAAGAGSQFLDSIRIIICTTDVTPMGDPSSPSNQLRFIYEGHFGTDTQVTENIEIITDLKVLENDPKLTTLCMFMHEADLMNSCAVSYEMSKHESGLISKEMNKKSFKPEDTLLFFKLVCRNKFCSDAADTIATNKFAEIYKMFLSDYENGNLPCEN